jgi:hypothetical protein
MDGDLKYLPVFWIPATPAGKTAFKNSGTLLLIV